MHWWTEPGWYQIGVAISALVVASVAATSAWRAYRESYRPIVRPVPSWDHGSTPQWVNSEMIVKNVGRGSAISVVVAREQALDASTLIGEVDVIEPLGALHGPNFVESSRVGRLKIRISNPANVLVLGLTYRILYQDVAAQWHETKFTIEPDGRFRTRLTGHSRRKDIPEWIQKRAQVTG